MNNRLPILNIWVDPVNKEKAINIVKNFLRSSGGPHAIFASNPEKNYSVPKDPLLYETYRNADLLIPDGVAVVLAAKFLYGATLARVPGVELMEDICRLAAHEGYKVFFYGAKESVNKSAAEKLQSRYPGLNIAGRSNGYLKEKDMPELIKKINASNAEILFLALGSPAQEKWFATHKEYLKKVKVCQGIGGTLDTIAGTVKRAPEFWQRLSAEWLYRLLSEPKRIQRQKVLPLFAINVCLLKLKNCLPFKKKSDR